MLVEKGYTMVEMIIVLFVLTTLSSMSLPLLKNKVNENEIKKILKFAIETASYEAMNEASTKKLEITKSAIYINGTLQSDFGYFVCNPNIIVFHGNGHVSGPMVLRCYLNNKEVFLKYSLGTGIYYE